MPVLGRLLKGCRDALLNPAEDPRMRWEDTDQRQQRLVEQLRRTIARVTITAARVEDQLVTLRALQPSLESQARRAVSTGNDELARAILRRQQHALAELAFLEDHLHDLQQQAQRLTVTEHQLAARIDAVAVRRELAAARLSAAEARAGIELAQELPEIDAALNHLDARAAALDELTDSGILGIAGLDISDADIDARLAKLKAEASSPAR